jgi:large subunit ribosomal protein L28
MLEAPGSATLMWLVIGARPGCDDANARLGLTKELTNNKECTVAANCDVCGKGPGFGHNISHSHRRTKRRWNPNIQRVRAVVGSTPKRLNVCTSCIKAGKVTRA